MINKGSPEDEIFMQRCIDLAYNGLGKVAPNPMVGAVLVNGGMIIGEGFHHEYGKPHAEVNAINDAEKRIGTIPENSTLYVNLEPCNHHGKTPPCTELIINKGIRRIVIGCIDPNEKVTGKGIERLQNSGCDVLIGIKANDCRALNKTFITYHEKHRPYIILKWAQSKDGYISSGHQSEKREWISNDYSRKLTHNWRSESQAIMVGTNTVLYDNPSLNSRDWNRQNPIRISLDKELRLPKNMNIFDQSIPTIIFTDKKSSSFKNLEYININFSENVIENILKELYNRNIQSLIVEGGSTLLNSFLINNYWDESRVFVGKIILGKGIKAPEISGNYKQSEPIENDLFQVVINRH
jgi:diaminohydroxyphosphoribosylaminopyrimidine deaminase/5-amino-6-(5-phosphoribosylamino)uracil reductase